MLPNSDPTRTLAPDYVDARTRSFDPALEAGLAAAFGPDPTPGGWSRPPLLRDDLSENAPFVQPTSSEMPRGGGDRYQLLGEIARGGMGVILKGRDPDLGRDLAFKVLKAELAGKPAAEQRFVEEAQVGGQLQHPGVVPVYDLGRFADGRPYFAMKLVKGDTLADLLAQRPEPSSDRLKLLQVFHQVCHTVAYAHARGVIHRDLKPSNVMVGKFGEVLVMDWGLAKVLTRGESADEERATEWEGVPAPDVPAAINTVRSGSGSETATGSVLGTPAFMSPEQAAGETGRLDERTDVFGLGAILCVLLTGKPPYAGAEPRTLWAMAARGELADASARLDQCGADAELIALCRRCLAPDRERRPRHAAEVAGAVGAYLMGVEDRARRADLDRAAAEARTVEERKRRRVQLALAANVLLLGGLVGLGAFWRERQVAASRIDQAERTAAEERVQLNVESAVGIASDLRAAYRFAEAKSALDQAAGLVPADDPAGLRAKLSEVGEALEFVSELDAIRMLRSTWIEEVGGQGRFDEIAAPPAYRAAFLARGLDVADADPEAVAARVRASAVRADLVAALDDWAVFEPNPDVRGRVLAVAQRADPGPWLDRFRDPAVRADKAKLEQLAGEADPGALAPGTVTALAELMRRGKLDPSRLLLAAQSAHPRDFPTTFALCQWYYRKRDPQMIGHCRTARALRPDNKAVLTNLGHALSNTGDLDGAIDCFRETIRLDPSYTTGHNNLGAALITRGDTGDLDAGIASLREAIRLDHTVANAHANLSNALRSKGELDAALQSVREAIRLTPKRSAFHSSLGVTLETGGNLKDAIASHRQAVRLDPKDPVAHTTLGLALAKQGEADAAIACYREAIRVEPNYAKAHGCLGLALKAKGDRAGAIACYREAIRLDPRDVKAHNNLGAELAEAGDVDGAIVCYREAVRLAPKSAGMHANLGAALWAKGDIDGTIACYREALRLDPNRVTTQNNLGAALQKKGDLDGAIACYRESIRLDPKVATAHENLGEALSRKGDLDGAANCFREAIRLDPKGPKSHFKLGHLLMGRRDVHSAIGCFRESIRLDPKYSRAHYNLGVALFMTGDLDGAIACYRESIRLDPGLAQAHNNLGNALLRKGDLDGATACLREAIRLDPGLPQAHKNLAAALKAQAERDSKREAAPAATSGEAVAAMSLPDHTCWSLIRDAAGGDPAARERFARVYLPVVKAYLAARWRGTTRDPDDAAQDVFVECFRSGGLLEKADPERNGGFRAYLLGTVRNVARRHEARKRLDAHLPANLPGDDTAPAEAFDRAWARSLLKEAARVQEDESFQAGPAAIRRVQLLRLRFTDGLPIRAIAEQWGEDAAKLHHEYATAREEFRAALRNVVGFHHPGAPPGDLDHLAAELLALLG